ncbi:MAG: hypothetical protein UW64_C0017G0018 [Microgenomates group bacterium GW2011_GWC1_44_37]|uniref:Uncharacterized protein n=1 Tax=Candidatus Collierbacteria bacterium GW2011_GWB2_44_22 TaxID=1618387 RepID=A0A0G1HYL7_9BACT|nr:MAG: hypothetical protein UW31_C0010G0061 [Candidatus Collierbacteria bacterium GW2011_GWA2_44_13]KKT50810.1 MAG: hypothetical protein UW42_C0014G0005 [Candidatus Collierbacteria bacterium GW2011_GWB1_44_197]KKT51653.1 MAG: hypothetical protein UW44_C0009G0017 [Candidatus Collierbacteria bacterium GW2011_GWB2_44_22]KKT62581.1 MAG: hypothetical protein UW56_C0005G0017 [Candidatus Collierbacteria bacterium GW2011_GWD1_44_27]KKT66043.1 MAG: hypothetical protein UW58_C0014G0030 [Candidatus Colli
MTSGKIAYMEPHSLKDEVVRIIRHTVDELKGSNNLTSEREMEILEFLDSRFDGNYPNDLLERRLNEMMSKFEELYLPLAEIEISKYKSA